mgnify:CR=1 FL=1
MMTIKQIWFDGDYIYGLADNGETYCQSLLWYPRLRSASSEERSHYTFSTIGIHWRQIDEDISFESFGYKETSRPPQNQSTQLLYHKSV